MTQALIGYTGFVGGNLLRQDEFEATYNSANIAEIEGRRFERLVCAGVTAVKWWANKNAEEDRRRIEGLIAYLSKVKVECFTLISTVDIYNSARDVTEDDRPDESTLHPYGLNRLHLEDFVKARFPRVHIVRLPALFGAGLKKNAIYDLMHDNMTDVINRASSFQWYPLRRLKDDLDLVERGGVELINFVTPPVSMQEIHQRFFAASPMGANANAAAHYDIRTKHAGLFGRDDGYVLSREEVLGELGAYLDAERVA